MKKTILVILMTFLTFTCGCKFNFSNPEIDYVTKYIAGCETADFLAEPSGGAAVKCKLKNGEAVSFVKNVENGYSKVAYEGVMGYVLAVYLDENKPAEVNNTESEAVNEPSPGVISVPGQDFVQTGYEDLMGYANEADIEKYISEYVRPTYNYINENIDSFHKESVGEYTKWYNESGICVKKEVALSENGGVSRQYYFSEESGELIFAFVFKGTHEYRLYFSGGKLIRTIDDNDNLVNNPTYTEDLELAWASVNEAYYP